MEEKVLIDELIADEIGEPFLQELVAAARRGDLCVEGHVKGEMVEDLEGNEEWLDKPIGTWEGLIYLQRCWVIETRVVKELKRLLKANVKPLDEAKNEGLNAKQQEAVAKGLSAAVFCLSGGPGTGKTHTIARIVKAFLEKGEGKVIVAAPTGKAVAQIKERLDEAAEAGTLHSILGVKNLWDIIYEKRQLDAGMVIVDECSMIDAGMWGTLLSAIKEGTRLVLVGDHDQLPPVEAGSVYGEICGYMRERCPDQYAHLNECMRSDRKEIVELAEKVKRGEAVTGKELTRNLDVKKWKGEFPGPLKGEADIEKIWENLKQFRILSCLREGPFGAFAINEQMLEAFRGEFGEGCVWPVPVMVTRTSYRLGICNGDMGVLLKRSRGYGWGKEDRIYFEKRSLPALLIPEFEVAYAISVHKSQGSEYGKVALIVPKGSENFGREILYTGITRARLSLEIYGEEETLKACVAKSTQKLSGIRKKLYAKYQK